MGGPGSGGFRVGAGRKPKSDAQRALEGGVAREAGRRKPARRKAARQRESRAARQETVQPSKPAPVPTVDEFAVPDDLTLEERQVYLRLAPHALAAQTLTPGTEYQFLMLCRNVVLERRLAGSLELAGGANHRGLLQRIDAQLLRFCLSPIGRPMPQAVAEPEDPFAEFEQPVGEGVH